MPFKAAKKRMGTVEEDIILCFEENEITIYLQNVYMVYVELPEIL